MVKYKIVWSEFAEWNLEQIYDYIIRRSLSEKLAKKYIFKLILRLDQLEAFPFSGKKETLLKGLGKDFRYVVFKDYKVIYFVSGNTIYITDVFHCKLAPSRIRKRNK